MKLPYQFTLGKSHYQLNTYRASATNRIMGCTYFAAQAMTVTVSRGGKPRKSQDIAETFWHEVTHAILHDMDHHLYTNERFVTDFSSRLSKAISSAKFA